MKILLNGIETEAIRGEKLIETIRRTGEAVPSLCYAEGKEHRASCMVCVVRNASGGRFIPSCSTVVTEGMNIDSQSEMVLQLRREAVELLLSNHRADCNAPCHRACPAGMDVATMNRLADEGRINEAAALLFGTLALPASLCYLCKAPCEAICRRKEVSEAVPIRELKKRIVDQCDAAIVARSLLPKRNLNRRIALVGSTPETFAAALRAAMLGYHTTLIGTPEWEVPAAALEKELALFRAMGVEIQKKLAELSRGDYEAVFSTSEEETDHRIIITSKQVARHVREGMQTINHYHERTMELPTENPTSFDCSFGRLNEQEKQRLRTEHYSLAASGCLYCDCDGKSDCRLRNCASSLGAKHTYYSSTVSSLALYNVTLPHGMGWQPAKCIGCGLCVYNSNGAFTFSGRGYDMQVVMADESRIQPRLCEVCPSGALYQRGDLEP